MALTPDLIFQGLVLSSIFLTAISLPKLLVYTGWSSVRLYVYGHLESPWIRMVLSEKMIQELREPDQQFAQTVKEMESYTHDMKPLLVELFSAAVILPLSAMGLHVEPDAVLLIVLLEALIVFVFLVTFIQFARMFRKLKKLKGGGPLA